MDCVVPISGVPVGLVDQEYESYPFAAVSTVLSPQSITVSINVQSKSAKKLVAPGVNKQPVLLFILGSSEITNNGFSVPVYVEKA